MAWKVRIVDVRYTEQQPDEDGVIHDVDVTPTGRFVVDVDYFDDVEPEVILLTHSFTFQSQKFTAAQALQRAKDYGVVVRDTRDTADDMANYEGDSFNIDQ